MKHSAAKSTEAELTVGQIAEPDLLRFNRGVTKVYDIERSAFIDRADLINSDIHVTSFRTGMVRTGSVAR